MAQRNGDYDSVVYAIQKFIVLRLFSAWGHEEFWNRRIVASYPAGGQPAWTWRHYGGSNPHNHHVHVSVAGDKAKYDGVQSWAVDVN